MNSVLTYLNRNIINEKLIDIDNSIIFESFTSKILIDLSKQLIDSNANKRYNVTFKKLFSYNNIDWHNISDDDFEIHPASEWEDDKLSALLIKKIRKIVSPKSVETILILGRNNKGEFRYMFIYNRLIQLYNSSYYNNIGQHIEANIRDTVDTLKGHEILFLDYQKFANNRRNIQIKRGESKLGMINFDKLSLSKYAEENKKRYKTIIASMHSSDYKKNDQLIDRAEKIISTCSKIMISAAKEPEKYLDDLYKISSIYGRIYSHTSYNNRTNTVSGEDGLLICLQNYIHSLNSMLKNKNSSNITYYKDDVDLYKKKLEKIVDYLEQQLKLYNF